MSRPLPVPGTLSQPSAPVDLHDGAEAFRCQQLRQYEECFFAPQDVTAGMENELQVAVEGGKEEVDLALSLIQSSFYKNLMLRAAQGELPSQSVSELRSFVEEEEQQVWENSWIRIPRDLLGPYAASVLEHDFLADKNQPQAGRRRDLADFLLEQGGVRWLRIPISYLLKISLAEAVGQLEAPCSSLQARARQVMRHFISDNISPEITSFNLSSGTETSLPGEGLAREGSRRFFFIQLLVRYAEQQFRLKEHGQAIHIYSAPNPPVRQQRLNSLISDELYCDLFLNPCLSGWPRGEEKRGYMGLCHRTLCRSQLNTIASLKEAGILTNNLVVLPNTSSTSLANNGTHITLGSKTLSQCYADSKGFSGIQYEKYFGDLVVKIVEHFLPLFVTTCSGAPYRLAFADFHPEKVLGFLPHQLDATHLRMIWRRWKKKAHLSFCGHDCTPVGPEWIDRLLSRTLGLKGDYLPDSRLINYLVALRSLEASPALDGSVNNQDILKKDLFAMGIFDPRMTIYLPYRLRDQASYGFSGFEGRHYSLFPDYRQSLAMAANIQALVTALAYEWVRTGEIRHDHIPDSPFIESERRQVLFNTAIGIPTFYVREQSSNLLLGRILALADGQRRSRRYKGYLRVEVPAYLKACILFLRRAALKAPAAAGYLDDLATLEGMIHQRRSTANEILTSGVVNSHQQLSSPLETEASEFNLAAEHYYRTELCSLHMEEGLQTLISDAAVLEGEPAAEISRLKERLIGPLRADRYIGAAGRKVMNGSATKKELHQLLLLFLLIMEQEGRLEATR
ncbi:hypothetical protein [Desulfogranum mediterraneum]|uniref:hypothetical protein n=1 Tax=Desulfogranum mediterraneum TaxID=160661 RepID=UPI0012947490|nr:hypothetical protein [Desulfogranum mediterraneum]